MKKQLPISIQTFEAFVKSDSVEWIQDGDKLVPLIRVNVEVKDGFEVTGELTVEFERSIEEIELSDDEVINGCVDMEITELMAVRAEMKAAAVDFDIRCQKLAIQFARLSKGYLADEEFFNHILDMIAKRQIVSMSKPQLRKFINEFRIQVVQRMISELER